MTSVHTRLSVTWLKNEELFVGRPKEKRKEKQKKYVPEKINPRLGTGRQICFMKGICMCGPCYGAGTDLTLARLIRKP